MKLAEACEALNAKLRVELKYSGRERVVEVHAAGYTRDEKPIMRVWQVRGGSAGGDSSGWKLLKLDELRHQKCSTKNLTHRAVVIERVTRQ